MIALDIHDQLTGKKTTVRLSTHDAKRLYLSLREYFGDIQYKAQPGQLITAPNARIKVND